MPKPILPSMAIASMLLGGGCSRPPQADPAAVRTPVPAAELRRILPGNFIDEHPYPCDAGPLALHRNGRFDWFSGWGGTAGTYRIIDGAVRFDGLRANSGDPHIAFGVTFAKDGNNRIHYRIDGEGERELRLTPIDRNTPFITCGNETMPVPPGERAP